VAGTRLHYAAQAVKALSHIHRLAKQKEVLMMAQAEHALSTC